MSEIPPNSTMPRVEISNGEARATVFHHGAHLTHWTPAGEEPVIWLSGHSAWEAKKPIRGGIPLCFPWFGPPPAGLAAEARMHGWARLDEWELQEHTDRKARFILQHDNWNLAYDVHAGRKLELELRIENAAAEARRCEVALHTYFAVGDIRQTTVLGLQGAGFVDKTQDGARRLQDEAALSFGAETDRVYFSSGPVEIRDAVLQRRIIVEKSGSGATVVWNPWVVKAAAMPDFGDDEWQRMLCVETANALDCALEVEPGASHTVTVQIRVEAMQSA